MSQLELPRSIAERTVPDVLDARAARIPDHVALVAPSLVAGEERRVTYRELRDMADRLAGALHEAGVHKGDRVGIMFDNDGALEAHVTYHASHRLGAINVPINTRYVERELAYVLSFIAPAAVVFGAQFAGVLGRLGPTLRSTALFEAADAPALGRRLADALAHAPAQRTPVAERDEADWIFTSGTTGNPKAVALTHVGSVACGHQAVPVWGLEADSVYQSFAPFFTSTGSHTNLLSCLVTGCTYAIEPEFEVHATLARLRRHGATSTFLFNSVLQLVFDRLGPEEIAAARPPSLRRVCYGGQANGAAFYHKVWDVLGRGWGVELVNVYGLTEGGTSGTMLLHDEHPDALARMGEFGLSIGRGTFHPWVERRVARETGEPVAPGEIGELWLRGPSTMARYVSDEDTTARALPGDGWLRTGDMATVDDADLLYFVDRDKALIRRGGLNISSAEVEGVLMEHPAVVEAAVVPAPNPVLGHDVRAVVVLAPDAPPTADELRAFCAHRLADYKVPTTFDVVDALPRNAMNRVVKAALTGESTALTGKGSAGA